jgi:hypothetical protein
MDFNPEKQVFVVDDEDKQSFGAPELPDSFPVKDAAQYLVRAEFVCTRLMALDITEFPAGAQRAQMQQVAMQNLESIATLKADIQLLSMYTSSPVDGAAAWLKSQAG